MRGTATGAWDGVPRIWNSFVRCAFIVSRVTLSFLRFGIPVLGYTNTIVSPDNSARVTFLLGSLATESETFVGIAKSVK